MGVIRNITADNFPKQGKHLGESVEVCFHYDTSRTVMGVIVRDDMEDPWQTIIRLNDGRYVNATECQYALRGQVTVTDACGVKVQ